MAEVELFTSWRKDNLLDLKVTKTKELFIDFRNNLQQFHLSQYMVGLLRALRNTDILELFLDNKLRYDSNVLSIY